jgi:hypothetical protein
MCTVLVVVLPENCGAEAEAITPAGAPVTVIVAGPANPFEPVTVTPKLMDSPGVTVATDDDRVIAICGAGPATPVSLPPPQPAASVHARLMA